MNSELEFLHRQLARDYMEYIKGLSIKEKLYAGELTAVIEKAQGLDSFRVHEFICKSSELDVIANTVVLLEEVSEKYKTLLSEYIEQRQIAMRAIEKLSKAEFQLILTLHYLHSKTWPQIALETFYTERWVKELAARALLELYAFIPAEWKEQKYSAI